MTHAKTSPSKECRCLELAPGATADAGTAAHLEAVSSAPTSFTEDFLICPYTDVVWYRTYYEERTTQALTTRTAYRQPPLEFRSVAKAEFLMYTEPSSPLSFLRAPCELPNPPLQGLIRAWVQAAEDVQWECGSLRQHGHLGVRVWLRLPRQIQPGVREEVVVASPLECITANVFRSGCRYFVLYGMLGCCVGELVVIDKFQLSSSEFEKEFGFGLPQRDLHEEWLILARERLR